LAPDGDARSWLLQIVRHTAVSWLQRNRPTELVSLEAEIDFGETIVTT
jgi:DNA-directed RNA polymerase specialized sigma24 family protein